MKFKARTDEKIYDDVKSAGQSFLGLRMENLLVRVNELDDKETKKKLIEEYYENQVGTHDKNFDGTRVRVNSAIRIIMADKVILALERIDGTDPRVLPEAVEKAKDTITKISYKRTVSSVCHFHDEFICTACLLQ